MSDEPGSPRPDRAAVLGSGGAWLATWSLRLVLVAAAAAVVGLVVGQLWVVVLPAVLGVVLATVLAPPTAWLRRHRVPAGAAAAITTLGFVAALVGLVLGVAPSVVGQVGDIADQASGGLSQVRDYLTGPPLNLGSEQITAAVDTLTNRLQSSASVIAGGVFTGVSVVTSALVTAVLVLLLGFYFAKDGDRFLPWVQRVAGDRVGGHVAEVGRRGWTVLSGFIRTQALVSLIDGTFIGLGLVVLGVPLALPLAVLTFILSFIPIIGAVVAGALAVLVALVTNGFTTALLALAVVLLVQQVEGNVLQPVLQSRSLRLHPAVVLLAVTGGGSLFGIVGAFLAVPVVAVAAEALRYTGERIDDRTGAAPPDRAA
ncbi:AI-2E family transporter [Rhodococcus antarcticus]|jgi:predicted PurR-regulated permease PerM|uniref:AI-2E family transporter n=1 Tax=Rhodococcus antarcticus TaxID=2987751 RepID=A0ABY6NZV1_9NOCA|nr:AI-2E family transporter [Rhodococcus antarcticus]UZJ24813.1 AI-2E family transporter [Rhodococcus antarcticus]